MSNTNKCAIAIPQVLDRKSKTKRKHGNINGPISKSVVEQYINALTYLYNHQLNIEKLFNKYDNPPIRERDISDIIDLKPNKIKNTRKLYRPWYWDYKRWLYLKGPISSYSCILPWIWNS